MTVFIIILVAIVLIMAVPFQASKKQENAKPDIKPEPTKEEKVAKIPAPPRPMLMRDVEYGAPEGMLRTHKNGERLTEDEEDFIQLRLRQKLPCCPDCESGHFLEGPTGGGCINVKCSNNHCGSKFNLMMPFGIDRISDASPDKPLEMVSFGPNR